MEEEVVGTGTPRWAIKRGNRRRPRAVFRRRTAWRMASIIAPRRPPLLDPKRCRATVSLPDPTKIVAISSPTGPPRGFTRLPAGTLPSSGEQKNDASETGVKKRERER